MADTRFNNIHPGLGHQEALRMLLSPLEDLDLESDRYTAAAHLVNFPGEATEEALLRCVADEDPCQAQRIARRKAVETLARLGCTRAAPAIERCLESSDVYLVENAAWALGELGSDNPELQARLIALLDDPKQSRRIIVQVLAKQNCRESLTAIAKLRDHDDGMLATVAIRAHACLSGDRARLADLEEFLFHPDVNVRRGVIQDLMDADAQDLIEAIGRAPVSPAFRLRGIRHLADRRAEDRESLLPLVDRQFKDHPSTLQLVHAYDQPPALEFLVRELYGTDYGRTYLAIDTLERDHGPEAIPALVQSFESEGWNDYGAHYHLMHLFGRLGDPVVLPLVRDGLSNRRPQFQKSRPAAALALAELAPDESVGKLSELATEAPSWELRYASLMGLESIGGSIPVSGLGDHDWMVRLRARQAAAQPAGSRGRGG